MRLRVFHVALSSNIGIILFFLSPFLKCWYQSLLPEYLLKSRLHLSAASPKELIHECLYTCTQYFVMSNCFDFSRFFFTSQCKYVGCAQERCIFCVFFQYIFYYFTCIVLSCFMQFTSSRLLTLLYFFSRVCMFVFLFLVSSPVCCDPRSKVRHFQDHLVALRHCTKYWFLDIVIITGCSERRGKTWHILPSVDGACRPSHIKRKETHKNQFGILNKKRPKHIRRARVGWCDLIFIWVGGVLSYFPRTFPFT